MKKIKIGMETADMITVATLKDYRKVLKKELKNHEAGDWLHESDVANNMLKVKYLTEILKDFGSE